MLGNNLKFQAGTISHYLLSLCFVETVIFINFYWQHLKYVFDILDTAVLMNPMYVYSYVLFKAGQQNLTKICIALSNKIEYFYIHRYILQYFFPGMWFITRIKVFRFASKDTELMTNDKNKFYRNIFVPVKPFLLSDRRK